jgi:hypothetical protein
MTQKIIVASGILLKRSFVTSMGYARVNVRLHAGQQVDNAVSRHVMAVTFAERVGAAARCSSQKG